MTVTDRDGPVDGHGPGLALRLALLGGARGRSHHERLSGQ